MSGAAVRLRFDPDDPVLARAAWSRLVEPTDLTAYQGIAEHGPVSLLRRLLDGSGEPRWRVRLPDLDPVRDLRVLHGLGGRLLVPDGPEWPAGLADLGDKVPICLWVRGPLALDQERRRPREHRPVGRHRSANRDRLDSRLELPAAAQWRQCRRPH